MKPIRAIATAAALACLTAPAAFADTFTKDREAEGSFGRYLATIWLDGENIDQWLLDNNYVSVYDH